MGHKSLPISGLYSNSNAIWHRFRDITTFTVPVNVTGWYLEKSFVFEKIVEITSHALFLIHV